MCLLRDRKRVIVKAIVSRREKDRKRRPHLVLADLLVSLGSEKSLEIGGIGELDLAQPAFYQDHRKAARETKVSMSKLCTNQRSRCKRWTHHRSRAAC